MRIVLTTAAVAYLLSCAQSGRGADGSVDFVLVLKSTRKLMLLQRGGVVRTYTVALGKHPQGPKGREGDGKTPEGHYVIDRRLRNSRFHRALHISYPNSRDAAQARASGMPAGGDIMIHGLPPAWGWIGRFHRWFDWTNGCIAVTNAEIDEIWRLVPDGTSIEIRP